MIILGGNFESAIRIYKLSEEELLENLTNDKYNVDSFLDGSGMALRRFKQNDTLPDTVYILGSKEEIRKFNEQCYKKSKRYK